MKLNRLTHYVQVLHARVVIIVFVILGRMPSVAQVIVILTAIVVVEREKIAVIFQPVVLLAILQLFYVLRKTNVKLDRLTHYVQVLNVRGVVLLFVVPLKIVIVAPVIVVELTLGVQSKMSRVMVGNNAIQL